MRRPKARGAASFAGNRQLLPGTPVARFRSKVPAGSAVWSRPSRQGDRAVPRAAEFFQLGSTCEIAQISTHAPSAERHARRKTVFSAERDKEFGGVVDDAGTDHRCRKRFRAAQNLHAPFTLSRLPASTLRAARKLRPESSASIFASSGVMPRPATPAGTVGSGKTRPRPRSFSSTVTGCFRKRIRRGRVEKRVPSFLWRSRRTKNTGDGDIRHAGSGDESDRSVSLNVLPDPARCLAGSDYRARN